MLLLLVAAGTGRAGDLPADPLGSVMWEDMAARFFADAPIVFDDRVKVMAPDAAEDQTQLPVTIDARALFGVREMVVLADLNPVPHVLTYRPERAKAFIGFRMKVEQATVIRAGVRTADGVWHLNGAQIDAAGGGCTAPSAGRADERWPGELGRAKAQVRRIDGQTLRVNFRLKHPMDTGLVDGIPPFYIGRITLSSGGAIVSDIELHEPVSEDPAFALMPLVGSADTQLEFVARDTEGNAFAYDLKVPPFSAAAVR